MNHQFMSIMNVRKVASTPVEQTKDDKAAPQTEAPSIADQP